MTDTATALSMLHALLPFLGTTVRSQLLVSASLCWGLSPSQVSSVQSFSGVWLFATPWTAARQASLSLTNSQSLFKLMSITSVMQSNHLILCHPLLLPPSIFSSIRVFSNESVLHIRCPKYWSFTFSISQSLPSGSFHKPLILIHQRADRMKATITEN